MLSRYIGNKSVILPDLLEAIGRHAAPGDLVCDVFSGSLAVSLALKRAGYRVAANDVNRFSAVYGRTLLARSEIPELDPGALIPAAAERRARQAAEDTLAALRGKPGFAYLEEPRHRARALALQTVASHLFTAPRELVPAEHRRSDFYDHYCEAGADSAFTSSRGRAGRRRFFTPANAARLDVAMCLLRAWHLERRIDQPQEDALLTIALDAVNRVANTQGTYHDFPRDRYDPRALKPLEPRLPRWDGLLDGPDGHIVGEQRDSLEWIAEVPEHKVLYIDPPYNFRQYTAYYFLPNMLCRYPSLADPDDYFGRIRYVRGQNMEDDFQSTFCSASHFLPSLRTLVERARAETVVLSYFDGRNHWSEFKALANGEGHRRLSEFFANGVFRPGCAEVVPVTRLNYQSYGGHVAREVQEYLFVAPKL